MTAELPADLVGDRQAWLLERLLEDRRIGTNWAADELGVSVDTIRRDLRSLHDRGLLRRVHGGAVPRSSVPASFAARSSHPHPSQGDLAAAVVQRFGSGDLVGLDAGSTSVEVACQIPQTLEITIVTNSPAVAVALTDHRSAEVVQLGGSLDLKWMATTGPETVDAWRGYRLDLAVVGLCGFTAGGGGFTQSRHEVATKQALMASAAESVVPLSAEKLGMIAPFHVADPSSFGSLVVDAVADKAVLDQYLAMGIDVTVAGP